jgi:hypothetical protein
VGGVITFVFHPQVIGRGHRLLALERFVDAVSALGVHFSAMADIADAVKRDVVFGTEAAA